MADKPITNPRLLCINACEALAAHIARQIISNAADDEDDPLAYDFSTEVVMMYAKDIARDTAELVRAQVRLQLPHASVDD